MNARVPDFAAAVRVCASWQVALGRALRVRMTAVSVAQLAPGVEVCIASGIVEAIGPDVTLCRPADRVCYALPGTPAHIGTILHLVDERFVTRPTGASLIEKD